MNPDGGDGEDGRGRLDAELAAAFLTSRLTEGQRGELVAAGEQVVIPGGEVVFAEGEPADDLWILLEGEVRLTRLVGHQVTVMATMTTPGQWAGGLRAWAADTDAIGYRATGTAVVDTRLFRLPSPELARLVEGWFAFGMHLTTGIFQTIRGIDAMVRQRASLIALGTMAAGLAHEINNPAAAAGRAVESLRTTGDDMVAALARMAEAPITGDQFRSLEAVRAELAAATPSDPSGALQLARQEDSIGELLEAEGVADPWLLAPELAAAGLDVDACRRVEGVVGRGALEGGLRWITSTHAARQLLDELAESTRRISELVDAVQSFSQVDRASVQRVDLHDGIESTLVMLGHKLRDVTVVRDLADDLPRLEADAGQLNQVWTNLIDNAIDAMDGRGTVTVTTRTDGDRIVVEIGDTGPGIDPAIEDRIFEAFFTTKDVGRGTGLGLDISRRIVVEGHGGEIDVDTSPDGTTFRVSLPINR